MKIDLKLQNQNIWVKIDCKETRWELRRLLTDVEDFIELWNYIINKECIEGIKILDDWQE